MTYLLRTLGSLSLYEGTAPDAEDDPLLGNSKSLALLAYVALAPGREASRGHLARLLWPDSERTQARRSLRQALYYLSKRAGGELLRAEDDAVTVAEERLDVDVWRFEAALREGRLEEAVSRYDGAFLACFGAGVGREFESWIETQNEWIWSGLKAAYHELVNRSIEDEDLDRAVRFGRAYVDLNPFDEAAQTTLVRALLARGDRVAAYQQYESFRTLLEEELDDEPEPGLTERIEALREEIFTDPDPARFGLGSVETGRRRGSGSGAGRSRPRAEGERSGSETGGALSSGPLRWALVGATSATLLFAVLAAVRSLPVFESRGAPGWEGADGVLRIQHGPDRGSLSEVRIDDGVAELSETSLVPGSLLSPSGRLVLEKVVTDSGPDLIVRERASGEVLATAAQRADETPLAWAPDESRVLFGRSIRLREDREYLRQLHLLRLSDASVRPLPDRYQHQHGPWAAWSPRGGRVAYVGPGERGDKDVFVMDADGERARNLTGHPATDRTPAWSPDGRWIVFASDRAGDLDLHVVPADGGEPERITFATTDEVGPVWIDENRIVFLVLEEDEGHGSIRLMDLTSRNTRELTGRIDGLTARRFRGGVERGGWVDTLALWGERLRLAVGQRTRIDMRARTRAGESVPVEALDVRWTSLSPAVAAVDGTGTVQGTGPGRARVVASYGGWRADTARVDVGATEARGAAGLLLREDWSRGIDDRRWLAFGDPPPRVVDGSPGGGGGETSFDPNGDANYHSGVVLREPVPLRDGLTVELDARLPLTDQLYQVLALGVFPADSAVASVDWERPGRGLTGLRMGGDEKSHDVRLEDRFVPLPIPSEPGAEHTYALQVEPDGHVSYVRDGKLLWRSARPVLDDVGGRVRVRLSGSDLHTEFEVHELRLWRGVRYVVADPLAREFRLVPRTGGPETDVEHTER